jgi:hypothetical protein
MIQQYCGRALLQATYTDEKYDGDGLSRDLIVRGYPIITLTSVYDDPDRAFGADALLIEDTGGLSSAHFIIINKGEVDNPGLIKRIDGPWAKGIQNIKVTYVGGYADASIPYDLVQAQIDWLTYIFRNKDMRIGVSGYRIGQYSVNFAAPSTVEGFSGVLALPPSEVRLVLDNYKELRMESSFE